MRTRYALLFTLLPFFGLSQGEYNWQFGLFGASDIPIKSHMPNMSVNWGAGAQVAYRPLPNVPVFLELRGALGQYSSRTTEETFVFDDGTSTVTDVSFSSNMHRLSFGTKIYYTSFYRPVRAYITPQIGYSFMKSRIRIADPEDTDGCAPLDNKIKHRAAGASYGLELGAEFDIRKIFTGNDRPEQRLYLSVSYLGSFNKMDYVNVRYMSDHEHGITAGDHNHALSEENRDLTAEFINLATENIHEHKIAEIYRTPLRFVTVNVGYVWYF